MLIQRPWAFWRRVQYGTGLCVFLTLVFGTIYLTQFKVNPTCFDGRQNGDERGVDCGGVCSRICAFEVREPTVMWSRSFLVTDGQYNAVAYIENPNKTASTDAVRYTFALYDNEGLIAERSGVTPLPEDNIYPIFEGRIETGSRVPTKTLLTLDLSSAEWYPGERVREQFRVVSRELENVDTQPRLNATIRNGALTEVRDVELIVTIFDANRNALTTSRTFVDLFPSQSEVDVVFTWPEPIAKTLRSCEIPTDVVLAIDLSGSMNNDSAAPPQPITAVLDAGQAFVSRLKDKDQVSIVTFATDAELVLPLTSTLAQAQDTVDGLSIDPREEAGSTNTGDAFVKASEELSSTRHNANARKVMVLLTDGLATAPDENPEEYALEKSDEVREQGVEVYAIGLGEMVNMEFIRAIAGEEGNSYQAIEASEIDQIYQNITAAICEDGPAIIEIIPKTGSDNRK